MSIMGVSSQDIGSYEHLGDQLTSNGSFKYWGGGSAHKIMAPKSIWGSAHKILAP